MINLEKMGENQNGNIYYNYDEHISVFEDHQGESPSYYAWRGDWETHDWAEHTRAYSSMDEAVDAAMKITLYEVAVYASNHTSRGRWFRAWDRDTDDGRDDVIVYRGDKKTLLHMAADLDESARTANAGPDVYFLRAAASIRDAVE